MNRWFLAVALAAVLDPAPLQPGESGLPGAAAVLYPSATDAAARCAAQTVVFADDRTRVFWLSGDAAYGAWGAAPFPVQGFGCAGDLAANGFVPAAAR